jgi:hypothetical protein
MLITPLYNIENITNPLEFNINTGITIDDEIVTIRPRTEKGWTLDYIINKESLTWNSGKTFYYWGIKDELNPFFYLDNNLSFSFTNDGEINWKSYRYNEYCDTVSGYTEEYILTSGSTPVLCSSGTSTDFNLTITFERDRSFYDCDIENQGGLNDQITGYTVTNPYGVVTGDTEEFTLVDQLGEKWLKESEMRMGTLKFYLNGRLFYKIINWEEIIPTVRASLNPIIQVIGGGTTGSGEIHRGVSGFNIKRIMYYEEPLSYLLVRNSYLDAKLHYDITECYEPCSDLYPFFTYVVKPMLSFEGMEDWGFVELYFMNDTGFTHQYTPTEIGNGWIEPGGGAIPIYSMFPFPQIGVTNDNGSLIYRYTYDPFHPLIHVQYPIFSGTTREEYPIKFRVNFFSNGTNTSESLYSLDLYYLNIINTLDVSQFVNINHLDIAFSDFSTLRLPDTANSDLGFDFHLYNVLNLKEVDMSSMILSEYVDNKIQIWYCENIEVVKLPSMGRVHRLELTSLPVIHIVQSGTSIYDHTIIIKDCQLLETIEGLSNDSPLTFLQIHKIKPDYFDVKMFPNLTNRSGDAPGVGDPCTYDLSHNNFSTESVNHILTDFVTISTSGYNFRKIDLTGNFPPDATSGGYNGIAARTALANMGFDVRTA